jgi:hypothetical protein
MRLALFCLVAACAHPAPSSRSTDPVVPEPENTAAWSNSYVPVPDPPRAADSSPASRPAAARECVVDDDCVRATCCHPTACVPKTRRPDCSDTLCTEDCRPGTMDCVASCRCSSGGYCLVGPWRKGK